MTTKDVVDKLYGVSSYTNENPLISSATTSVQELFGGNPQRLQWFCINLGANPVYLSFGTEPSATNGVLLAANGGNISFNFVEDANIPIKPVYCIASGGTSDLYSFEQIAY